MSNDDESRVKKSFFKKTKKLVGKLPFIPDVLAMFYCMIDPMTPLWAKGAIAAALAYFIMPIDAIPDVFFPVGYADDAAVIAGALATVEAYVTKEHKMAAKRWLEQQN